MKPENPAEPFKRAVAIAVRSLAGEPELEVNFSAEPPALKGLKARLPLPSRNLPPSEVAIVRGAGDAYALRRAYHEDALHEQLRPQSADAAAIFEAAEQARVEAIGSLAHERRRRQSRGAARSALQCARTRQGARPFRSAAGRCRSA